MRVFSVVLCILIITLVVYVFLLKKQINKLSLKIKKMPTGSQYGSRLFLDFREKNLIQLVDSLNEMVDQYESEKVHIKKSEENLHLSITDLSHDLRTPLTVIDGYIQLLRHTDDPTKKMQYLDIIEQSVSKLVEMTNQFYDLTRIDINQKGMELSKITLNEIVQDDFLNFFDSFETAGVEIHFEDNQPRINILADKVLLNRVIQNVIQNILRYAKDEVHIEFAQDNKFGSVMIKNNIKSESRVSIEKVFDRFYTEKQSRTNAESSGLGLYISKRMIENMNGSMDAELNNQQFLIKIKLPSLEVEV